jgi:hypothetical protein
MGAGFAAAGFAAAAAGATDSDPVSAWGSAAATGAGFGTAPDFPSAARAAARISATDIFLLSAIAHRGERLGSQRLAAASGLPLAPKPSFLSGNMEFVIFFTNSI